MTFSHKTFVWYLHAENVQLCHIRLQYFLQVNMWQEGSDLIIWFIIIRMLCTLTTAITTNTPRKMNRIEFSLWPVIHICLVSVESMHIWTLQHRPYCGWHIHILHLFLNFSFFKKNDIELRGKRHGQLEWYAIHLQWRFFLGRFICKNDAKEMSQNKRWSFFLAYVNKPNDDTETKENNRTN